MEQRVVKIEPWGIWAFKTWGRVNKEEGQKIWEKTWRATKYGRPLTSLPWICIPVRYSVLLRKTNKSSNWHLGMEGKAKEKWNHLEAADCSFSKWLNAKFNWMCSTRENSLLIKTSILEVPSNLASFLNYNMCKRKTPTMFYPDNSFFIHNLYWVCNLWRWEFSRHWSSDFESML